MLEYRGLSRARLLEVSDLWIFFHCSFRISQVSISMVNENPLSQINSGKDSEISSCYHHQWVAELGQTCLKTQIHSPLEYRNHKAKKRINVITGHPVVVYTYMLQLYIRRLINILIIGWGNCMGTQQTTYYCNRDCVNQTIPFLVKEVHFLCTHACFLWPNPPNFFISLQFAHTPQSDLLHPSQLPHAHRLNLFP